VLAGERFFACRGAAKNTGKVGFGVLGGGGGGFLGDWGWRLIVYFATSNARDEYPLACSITLWYHSIKSK